MRNHIRGQGFFGVDTGVIETWKLSESQALKFSWNVYNVTHTRSVWLQRRPNRSVGFLGIAGLFGKYTQI